MTLVFAWLRNHGGLNEFVLASDSRLSGEGAVWDTCPKIIQLPRSDAAMAFAGSTSIAYPALLQVSRAVQSNPAQVERRYDVTALSNYVLNVINQMLDGRDVDRMLREATALEKSETRFLLAGYSWRYSEFRAWTYEFNRKIKKYERHPLRIASTAEGLRSDQRWTAIGDAAAHAGGELNRRLDSGSASTLNMEPFEVLRDVIRSREFHTVGGAPQVIKIYRHMNTQALGVLWRPQAGLNAEATYGGRPLLEYEKPYYTFIDADDPTRHSHAAARSATSDVDEENGVDDFDSGGLVDE